MALNTVRLPLMQSAIDHCKTAFGLKLEAWPWEGVNQLPLYLSGTYQFFRAKGADHEFMFVVLKDSKDLSPIVVGRQMQKVREEWTGDVVFVSESVSNAARKRMVEDKIPFIIPGTQLYLPMIGMDFSEKFRQKEIARSAFRPSAQALVLDVLHNPEVELWTPTLGSKRLGFTIMTMTRAFNEIEAAGIGEHKVKGMERQLRFPVRGKKLWEMLLPHLKSPVKNRLFVPKRMLKAPRYLSGDSALEEYTDLGSPGIPVFALGPEGGSYGTMKVHAIPKWDAAAAEVEFWSYSPSHFARKGFVDRLSLFLETEPSGDERVEMAKDKLLEDMPW